MNDLEPICDLRNHYCFYAGYISSTYHKMEKSERIQKRGINHNTLAGKTYGNLWLRVHGS